MIETCDGSVSGTVARAFVNRVPRTASLSIDGVSQRPTRSARSVSIVMSTMGCRDGMGLVGAGGWPERHAADERNKNAISADARIRISVQLP